MMTKNLLMTAALTAVVSIASAQCGGSKASASANADFGQATASSDAGVIAPIGEPDLIDLAVSVEDLSTLVTAVKAAGLVETLKGKGPFTIFAPTNKAFADLPAGTLDMLLKPENKEKLVKVLTYHVVPGMVMAKDVPTADVKTVQGQTVALKKDSMGVTVNNAKVVAADVEATNGVIHVIDTVILPK